MVNVSPISDKRLEVSGFALEKTVKSMKLSFSRILMNHPEIDVTVDQWIIINMLKTHGPLSQQEIVVLTCKDAPTITRMVDLLAAKNLVSRRPDEMDRRKFIVTLTETGKIRYSLIEPIVSDFRSKAYQDISEEELAVVSSVVAKIFKNLSKNN